MVALDWVDLTNVTCGMFIVQLCAAFKETKPHSLVMMVGMETPSMTSSSNSLETTIYVVAVFMIIKQTTAFSHVHCTVLNDVVPVLRV